MAQNNNLGDFLTSIADAIRDAEGSSAQINAQDFETRIRALGGGTDRSIDLINGTITSYSESSITKVKPGAFYGCNSLTSVDCPNATSVGDYGFYECRYLTSLNLPKATTFGTWALGSCQRLNRLDLGATTSLGGYSLYGTSGLMILIIRTTTQVCTIQTTTFTGSYIANNNAKIYVPDELVEDYKTATNWSALASKIYPLSELPA